MSNGNTLMDFNTSGGLGYLQVNTFFQGVGSPAQGATVRVFNSDTKSIVSESQTDAQGQVKNIALITPPIEYSLQYGLPRPFNQYDVQVIYQDYQSAYISNVQLFPEQTAIQNVLLLPSYNDIDIPYPTLWGTYPPKIPESEVKKLPLPTGQIVLPEPVVPSLITVHEGRPEDSSASNYTVGFKDYIKNVASCEIYSTWPREAIKANVFAILSFTLSRVYTEWYRGKGYGFTITNSTAFDQAFSFGRNIFDEISEVVDEIFTTYISRPDLVQPLFTQYCDGKRVKRAGWLSQWGSKELADQGLNALQILKTYYGSDIVLKQAKKVEGIPLSFTNVLKIGSTGDAVKTIQQQLNTISNNYPLIKKVVVDGVYGASTAEAVRTFQQIFDLPETGEVNFPTWYSISNIFVAISKLGLV
ncbi:peptidoglycan-binding protein [Intestinimonas massiliensis]|uniref:Peptidoglycan-binding protein n=1 Tax=Intestinimonas massiliensis (ex Afouda et al. 2020) TaxID=1673721 RepID=A0ABS9MEI1_9FIRM|nr:peptidoglycan-binding protein [Intestinimonas massiliensis (ex Afouda et al. 2020)]MCG4529163.1 peptidoglycan-binding protein [Intestinimonas massiliensis (ex Afouda et al. 2020)]MCQ4808104.1 peptidoglycan-binding protein [Intestinimonas massiliensis (ex Afouda et al. 2020)]